MRPCQVPVDGQARRARTAHAALGIATVRSTGWTLVELVVVMIIIGALAGGAAVLLVQGTALWSSVSGRLDAMSQADLALDRWQRDAAQIKDDAGVSAATSTAFAFTTVGNEAVRYEYQPADATFRRNGDLLASGVSSVAFQYWNTKGQVLAAPLVTPPAAKTDLWRVGCTLTVQNGPRTVTVESQVLPRNFFRANK